MGLIADFKEFALRGNVMDMAVGVIIGAAFNKIVTSAVNDLIMPPMGLVMGKTDFSTLTLSLGKVTSADGSVQDVTFRYGAFLQATIDFLILAFVIFLMVQAINKLRRTQKEQPPEVPEAPPADQVLLAEIRDLLKQRPLA